MLSYIFPTGPTIATGKSPSFDSLLWNKCWIVLLCWRNVYSDAKLRATSNTNFGVVPTAPKIADINIYHDEKTEGDIH